MTVTAAEYVGSLHPAHNGSRSTGRLAASDGLIPTVAGRSPVSSLLYIHIFSDFSTPAFIT